MYFVCGLHMREAWSLMLKEEQRLMVFENRVLRGIFGSKGNEVTGEWRKLHNDEFHNLYSSPNDIKMMKSRAILDGDVGRGKCKNARQYLLENLKGK
jgi:hypothetical protein